MNMYNKYILPMALAVVMLATFSCSTENDNTEAPTDLARRLLNGTWKVKTLTIDDVDKTADFSTLEITFADGTYKSSNSAKVWPSSGAWVLKDEKTINRDNELDVRIDKLDEQSVTLSLTQDTAFGIGRVSTLGGHLVFELVKK